MTELNERFLDLLNSLEDNFPNSWMEIDQKVALVKDSIPINEELSKRDFQKQLAKGTAFITFGFGTDGVAFEIGKYAQALGDIYTQFEDRNIGLIAGDIYRKPSFLLPNGTKPHRVNGISRIFRIHNNGCYNEIVSSKESKLGSM